MAAKYCSITANLVIRGARQAIEFYKKTFDAEETFLLNRPDGAIMHAELRIGDSLIMIADECAPHQNHDTECVRSPSDLGGTTVNFYLMVPDADAAFSRAIQNGAVEMMAVTDMFWGDRVGMFKDPCGHFWSVATHKDDVDPEQLKERMEKFLSGQNSCS